MQLSRIGVAAVVVLVVVGQLEVPAFAQEAWPGNAPTLSPSANALNNVVSGLEPALGGRDRAGIESAAKKMGGAVKAKPSAIKKDVPMLFRSPQGFKPFSFPGASAGASLITSGAGIYFQARKIAEMIGEFLHPTSGGPSQTFRFVPEGPYGSVALPALEETSDCVGYNWNFVYGIGPRLSAGHQTSTWCEWNPVNGGSFGCYSSAGSFLYAPFSNNYITEAIVRLDNGQNNHDSYNQGSWVNNFPLRIAVWRDAAQSGDMLEFVSVAEFTPEPLGDDTIGDGDGAAASDDTAIEAFNDPKNGLHAVPGAAVPTSGPALVEREDGTIEWVPEGQAINDDGLSSGDPSPAPSVTPVPSPSPVTTTTTRTKTSSSTTTTTTTENPDGSTTTTSETTTTEEQEQTETPPQGKSFVVHFVEQVGTKFPFDWFKDAAIDTAEQDLKWVSWQGKTWGNESVEAEHDFNWLKPWLSAFVAISMIGLGVLALLWI